MKNSALSFRRWAVILAAALSGIIVLVSMFADPVPGAEGRELIQGMRPTKAVRDCIQI